MANTFIAIGTFRVSSPSVTSFTWSSIPQTYKNLVIMGACAAQSSSGGLKMFFNGDETTTYKYAEMYSGTTNTPAFQKSTATDFALGNTNMDAPAADHNLGVEIVIGNYTNTTDYKNYLYRGNGGTHNSTTQQQASVGGGTWSNISAITSIKIAKTGTAYFAVGTSFTLYGLT